MPATGNGQLTPFVVSINDACYLLGCGRSKLYELMRGNRLKYVQSYGRRRIPVAEIERMVEIAPPKPQP